MRSTFDGLVLVFSSLLYLLSRSLSTPQLFIPHSLFTFFHPLFSLSLFPLSLPSPPLPSLPFPPFPSPTLTPSLLDIPASGTLQEVLPVSYVIHNHTLLVQEFEVRIGTSDTFMYSGQRLVRPEWLA